MRDFIAFQQFSPEERICGKKCIWCSGIEQQNKAHIISRKLTLTSHRKTVLKYSVCNICNSKCSELEGWILRNTPLGWLRFFYYLSSNKNSETNSIPSYFYAPDVKEWLLFKLEGKRESRKIESQLILKINNEFQLFTESSPLEIMDRILTALGNQSYRTDVKDTFPEDFSPRILVDGEMVILIARCKEELDRFVKILKLSTLQPKNAIKMQRDILPALTA